MNACMLLYVLTFHGIVVTQIALTLAIFLAAVFLLGFVADPIINLYVDPIYTFTTSGRRENLGFFADDDDDAGIESWLDHFLKGLASLGLLGFVKVAFSMSPIAFPNFRSSGIFGGGGRAARAGATGRDRIASMSWIVLFLGIVTFLWVRMDVDVKAQRCKRFTKEVTDVSL